MANSDRGHWEQANVPKRSQRKRLVLDFRSRKFACQRDGPGKYRSKERIGRSEWLGSCAPKTDYTLPPWTAQVPLL